MFMFGEAKRAARLDNSAENRPKQISWDGGGSVCELFDFSSSFAAVDSFMLFSMGAEMRTEGRRNGGNAQRFDFYLQIEKGSRQTVWQYLSHKIWFSEAFKCMEF